LANVRQDVAGLQAELKAGFSKALTAVLREREAEEEQVAQQLQEELARAVRPAARAWRELPDLANLGRSADDSDAVRLRLRPILRRLVEDARVLIVPRGSWRLLAVQFFFVGGARRDYLIAHQTAGFRRPGGWWARSFADACPDAEALDLRKPAHA